MKGKKRGAMVDRLMAQVEIDSIERHNPSL